MAAKKRKTKKKSASKTASKKPNALDFAREYLRRKPDAPFAEIRDAAAKKRLKLYPISYGRAQALEGIVKVAKYGSKKKAAKTATTRRGPGRPKGSKNKTRGPGRPRKTAASGLESIEGLVDTIKGLQSERDQAMRTIEKIRDLLDKV